MTSELLLSRQGLRKKRRNQGILLGVLALLCLIVFFLGLGMGEYPLNPAEVASTLFGGGTRQSQYVVFSLRLPRLTRLKLKKSSAHAVSGTARRGTFTRA